LRSPAPVLPGAARRCRPARVAEGGQVAADGGHAGLQGSGEVVDGGGASLVTRLGEEALQALPATSHRVGDLVVCGGVEGPGDRDPFVGGQRSPSGCAAASEALLGASGAATRPSVDNLTVSRNSQERPCSIDFS